MEQACLLKRRITAFDKVDICVSNYSWAMDILMNNKINFIS